MSPEEIDALLERASTQSEELVAAAALVRELREERDAVTQELNVNGAMLHAARMRADCMKQYDTEPCKAPGPLRQCARCFEIEADRLRARAALFDEMRKALHAYERMLYELSDDGHPRVAALIKRADALE